MFVVPLLCLTDDKAIKPRAVSRSTSSSVSTLKDDNDAVDTEPTVIGNDDNIWRFNEATGWDLTHRRPTSTRTMQPVTLKTTKDPITIDPYNSVLVIIDMQNLFLSSALGNKEGDAQKVEAKLLETVIPAARRAGIQIMYLNWGVTEYDALDLPPSMARAFNFTSTDVNSATDTINTSRGKEEKAAIGIGDPLGEVNLPDGTVVDAGKRLVRDQWNTELHGPLKADYDVLRKRSDTKPMDIRTYRSRVSGFWSDNDSPCLEHLQIKGITTLFFAGINNDDCIITNIQDAVRHGFDAILLEDACGTTNSEDSWEAIGTEGRKTWGFVSSCDALAEGVDAAGFKSD